MTWHAIMRGATRLSAFDEGVGLPVIFQHGLGGDEAQVSELFPETGFRRLTLECRAHGNSQPGDAAKFSIADFADDVIAFADECGVERFAMGGISMGAAIAMRVAVRNSQRVTALILARPAWLWEPAPENMTVFTELAYHLTKGDQGSFDATETAKRLGTEAPDNLASLRKFFARRDLATTAKLLAAIAADGPGITEEEFCEIRVPVLILGNRLDWVHPLAHAQMLAQAIPHAKMLEVFPKASDEQRHTREMKSAIRNFLIQEGQTP